MRSALSSIAAWWAVAGGALLLAITLVTSLNVSAFLLDTLVRSFGVSVQGVLGYEDMVRLMISCAGLMFFPYCQLKRGHVAVDLFVAGLPRRVRVGLERLWLALTALIAVFLGYWMAIGLVETRADHTSTPILGWPEWPFYIPGLISLALWALIAAGQCAASAEEVEHGA